MLNYELAKKLRDNGFSQGSISGIYTNCNYENGGLFHEHEAFSCQSNNPCDFCKHILEKKCTAVYVPTLSELIEACGDDFGTLHHIHKPKIWTAVSRLFSRNGTKLLDRYEGKGDNPETAVANLWLKLNKK